MLTVDGLEVAYGDLQVIWGVTFEVPSGSIVAIIGPNGAGKTTTLRALTGTLPVLGGEVVFKGEPIQGLAPHEIVERGMVMIPEAQATFASLSVVDNLEIGAFGRRARGAKQETLAQVFETFPRLAERPNQLAGTLSGGERRMLSIGKALMGKPDLLILDEPSLGLAPIIVERTFEVIEQIRGAGVSVLMVEQHVEMALEVVDHAYIVEMGRVVLEGSSDHLKTDSRVLDAYLSI
jgi:branched-chain amino acid transport system ATP-binding protein